MHTGPANSRGSRGALVGAAIGAGLSAAVWFAERAAVAGGANAAGLGFGDSHLLFFLSFPWSLAVLAVGATAESLGLHALPLRAFFFVMPTVAGAGWGWIAGRVVRRRRRRRAGHEPPGALPR